LQSLGKQHDFLFFEGALSECENVAHAILNLTGNVVLTLSMERNANRIAQDNALTHSN
jgi:hypothetical protein